MEELITATDTNQDGHIDIQEWRTAWLGGLAAEIAKLRKSEMDAANDAANNPERRASVMAFAKKAEAEATTDAPEVPEGAPAAEEKGAVNA